MHNFDPMISRRIVVDLGRTHNAIDASLKKLSTLTSDILEAFAEAQLSDAASQPALEEISEGFASIVKGRGAFVSVHQRLIDMKMDSNLRQAELGCTFGPLCPVPFVEPADERVAA